MNERDPNALSSTPSRGVAAPWQVAGVEDSVAHLGMVASAISGRPLRVAAGQSGDEPWTDGNVVFVDAAATRREQIESLAVQASLLAAGSLERGVVRRLVGRPALKRRYLALEGHRALALLEPRLPPCVRPLIRADVAAATDSPVASLATARHGECVVEPPPSFGTIRARQLLSSARLSVWPRSSETRHARVKQPVVELAEDGTRDERSEDVFASPVGGGGAAGSWLSKLLSAVRQLRGGGSPGADAQTHWTRTTRPGTGSAQFSTGARAGSEASIAGTHECATTYPEWDVHAERYREGWCTVLEREPTLRHDGTLAEVADHVHLRRSLARLGLGIDRRHRQAQGDDIDLDAAIEARTTALAGSPPDEAQFIDSVRLRRDLSVLLLLDVSGSSAEPAASGDTVHTVQRAAAAALLLALHELGDRVALYAYHSQGRSAVQLLPVKRFAENAGPRALQRLGSLVPGGYSRLGAAIRHGTAVLKGEGGTPMRLLVVLSDGLAYDHGYDPVYGAADARHALGEARRQGVGPVCLSMGAGTDADALRRVFGASAHAAVPSPAQLSTVIGPLFRSGLGSASVRRGVS